MLCSQTRMLHLSSYNNSAASVWFVFLMYFVSIIGCQIGKIIYICQIGLSQIIAITFHIALTFPQVGADCSDFDLSLSTVALHLPKAEVLQGIHQEID